MQLAIRYGAEVFDTAEEKTRTVDLVVAQYDDAVDVDLTQHPGCRLIPFAGLLSDLGRLGAKPDDPTAPDSRPYLAPASVDLTAYAALVRYYAETGAITATVGGKSVPVSTSKADRNGYRDTMLGILAGIREDGATFKFADGVSRAATNAEIQTAIAAAFARVQALFDAEGAVQADRAKSRPTIKTLDDVDAAFAAVAA